MSEGSDPTISPPEYFQSQWAHYFIFGCAILSIVWGVINVLMIRSVEIENTEPIERFFDGEKGAINDDEAGEGETSKEKAEEVVAKLIDIGQKITDGAIQFLIAEYTYLGLFCLVFAVIIGFTVDLHEMKSDSPVKPGSNFPYTATAFLIGAGTSIVSGYVGMRIAVYTNNRTTYNCCLGEEIQADIPDSQLDDSYLDALVKFYNIKSKEAKDAV
jgi:hypothetical protein